MSLINHSTLIKDNFFRNNFNKIFVICLSIGLGLVLGFLSSQGEWLYAIIMALLIPSLILLSGHPFLGVMIWILVMPLSSALPNSSLVYWFVHRLLIPLTLSISFISQQLNVARRTSLKITLPDVCVLLFAAYIPVSSLFFDNLSGDLMRKYLDRMLIPIIMYLTIRCLHLDKTNYRLLEWTSFCVAIIQITIGFTSWIIPSLLPKEWQHHIGYRTAGSLGDPAVFTSLLVFCAIILINAAMQRKNDLIRFLFLIVSGLCFLSVFISLSRGSWLGGVFVLVSLIFLWGKKLFKVLIIGSFTISILAFSLFSNQISMVTKRINEQKPIDDRIVVTDAMIQMVLEKPFFGWGYDSLNSNVVNYYRHVGSASILIGFTTSHNTFLTILTELGIIGFLLYMIPFIWLLIQSINIWKDKKAINTDQWLLLMTIWLGCLQYFVVSNFMDMRFFPIGLTLWWMMLGLITNIILDFPDKTKNENFGKNRLYKQKIRIINDPLMLEIEDSGE